MPKREDQHQAAGGSGAPVHILWEGTQFALHSLAHVNREICCQLIEAGAAELSLVPYEPDQFSAAGDPKLEKLRAHDIRVKGLHLRERATRPHLWVRHQWPPRPTAPPGGDKWVIMQPWEYSAVPQSFIEIFTKADEIWTPSHFSRRAFVRSGLPEHRVHVVPCGVDPHVFAPAGDIKPLETKKSLKLLYVGGTIYRKGVDVLLESYCKAFGRDDDVCLVIKDFGKQTLYKGQTAEGMIRSYQDREDAPEIIYLDEDLSERELAMLYRACDVFVAPYRGEGFSLPTLEAMACGLPVVVTRGGSTDDFVDEAVGWCVEAQRKSIGCKVYGQLLEQEGYLLEPGKAQLTGILSRLPHSRDEIRRRGAAAAQRANSHWTWQHAAAQVLKRVDAISGTVTGSQLTATAAAAGD